MHEFRRFFAFSLVEVSPVSVHSVMYHIPLGGNVMSFDLEGILDSAKEKVVEAATEKFGSSATPIAENVAEKMEEVVAEKMGVPLHGKTEPSAS
jgi:hypothetical protein